MWEKEFYKATHVTSDRSLIPRHGHSIIVIIDVTNAMGGSNAVINYNINHGSTLIFLSCLFVSFVTLFHYHNLSSSCIDSLEGPLLK